MIISCPNERSVIQVLKSVKVTNKLRKKKVARPNHVNAIDDKNPWKLSRIHKQIDATLMNQCKQISRSDRLADDESGVLVI